MEQLKAEDVKRLIDRVGESLGYDHTYGPIFPDGRQDVCAINRMVENGSTYGYNVIYLVWTDIGGNVQYKEIANTRATKDYMHIDSITVNGNKVTVSFGSGGSFSGTPWGSEETEEIN